VSTTARRAYLSLFRRLGIKSFRSRSGFGYPFICHLGDRAGEVPYYDRQYSQAEMALMTAWCGNIPNPVIFDIGANVGFVATQLAQALAKVHPRIYAFEPIPSTFCKLLSSIEELDLEDQITPICSAVSDSMGFCSLAYNPKESLFAQVRTDAENIRAGTQSAVAPCVTIDSFVNELRMTPALLKVDVEGLEGRVFQGARQLLSGAEPPGICFEFNPVTLKEVGSTAADIGDLLPAFRLYYVDDFEGQKLPFGQEVARVSDINWVCNLFAVSERSEFFSRRNTALSGAKGFLAASRLCRTPE
jgi:FkbM family methyltransferase